MALCFSCVGAAVGAVSCPRCKGSGCEPGSATEHRVDVASVADPDQPFHVAHFEAADLDAAVAAARRIVAGHATNPELHYGELYVVPPGAAEAAAYVCSLEPPADATTGSRQ